MKFRKSFRRHLKKNAVIMLAAVMIFSLLTPGMVLAVEGEGVPLQNTGTLISTPSDAMPTENKDDGQDDTASPSDARYDEDGFLLDGKVALDIEIEDAVQEKTDLEEEILFDGVVGKEDLATPANALMQYEIIPVQVNPLYADVITEEELNALEQALELQMEEEESSFNEEGSSFRQTKSLKKGALRGTSSSEYAVTLEDAAAVLRDGMKNRSDTIEVKIDISATAFSGLTVQQCFENILEAALDHTGNPKEGDYIRYQHGAVGATSSTLGSERKLTYRVPYYDTAEQENEMDEAVAEVLSELNLKGKAEDYKIAKIYDYITSHVVYDYENLDDDDYELKYTAYAALVNGTAVCQGYANLFYRLCLEVGVDARIVAGTANGGNHAWNIVKIGSEYFNIDSTWDAGESPSEYSYFLKNSDEFSMSHTRGVFETINYTLPVFDTADHDHPYPDYAKVPVTGIVLSVENGTAVSGGDYRIDVTYIPENAYNRSYTPYVTISSSSLGELTYIPASQYIQLRIPEEGAGTVNVTVTSLDEPAVSSTCSVNVISQDMAGVLNKASLTLGGDIGLNYMITVPQNVNINGTPTAVSEENVVARFTFNGKSVDAKGTCVDPANHQYKYTYNVAAKEMDDTIGLKLFYKTGGDNEIQLPLMVINENSEKRTVSEETGYQYSVKDYISAASNVVEDQKLADLLNTMRVYGQESQLYFGYNTSAAQSHDLSEVTTATLASHAPERTGSLPEGITEHTTSLVFNTTTDIKHYFRLAKGHSISEYSFTIGDQVLQPEPSGSRYYVRIPAIAAHKLDTRYDLTVSGNGGTFTDSYSALSYCYTVLRLYSNDPANAHLCNLVRALYLYNVAADNYAASNY